VAQPRDSGPPIYNTFVSMLIGAVVFSTAWYFGVGLLTRIDALRNFPRLIKVVQYLGPMLMLLGIVTTAFEFRETVRARRASRNVNEAFDRIKDQSPGRNIAEIAVEEVAASVKGTNISKFQIEQLVDQRKQQLLIDDDYFQREVSFMIVDYLQPLPRNAKRIVNRFRVNLLIAHARGLLTSDPKVNPQQIGKWLVLSERWPQLSRSLSAIPKKMAELEKQSQSPAPSRKDKSDDFMESVKTLAPSYIGDEDLRNFVRSRPPLAGILPRLVHYGTAKPELTSTPVRSST
jgi:hypothetical protein